MYLLLIIVLATTQQRNWKRPEISSDAIQIPVSQACVAVLPMEIDVHRKESVSLAAMDIGVIRVPIRHGRLLNVSRCVWVCADMYHIQVKRHADQKDLEDWNPALTRCSDNTFCCGDKNSTCCDSGLGVSISATRSGTLALSLTAIPTTSHTSTPAQTTASGTATTSSSSSGTAASATDGAVSKSASTKSNNSVAIAAGVGVTIGVVLVCGF